MHETLPHSKSSNHAMDDWELGVRSGEKVYGWLFDAEAAGKHVYIVSSHSHYYSPNIYNTPYWKQQGKVVPGWMTVARRGAPLQASAGGRSGLGYADHGYLQAGVHPDGSISFTLQRLTEERPGRREMARRAA